MARKSQISLRAPGRRKTSLAAALRTRLGISRDQFARLVSLSTRRVADLEAGNPKLYESTKRRVQEVRRLVDALEKIVRREHVGPWLLEPNDALDGFKPVELMERGETDRVWRLIFVLESGVAS